MLGFNPLAATPLSSASVGDINFSTVNFQADDITSSAPVIDIVSIFEEETVPISDITLGAPTIGAVTALYTDVLSADEITLATPVVDTASVFEDETVTVDDVITGSPVVDGATPVYTDVLFADDITSSVPVVDGATPQYTDVLAANEITLGVPTVDTAPVFERETCDVDDVTLGAPSIETATVAVISNFFPQGVTAGSPDVDTLSVFQEYILAAEDITAGVPTFAVRFTWDFQELVAESWREAYPNPFPPYYDNLVTKYALVEGVLRSVVGFQPEEDLFVNTIVGGRSLGSVHNGSIGYVNANDANRIIRYISGASISEEALDYIENYMLPYMAANPDLYSKYYTGDGTSTRLPNWSEQEESTDTWTEQAPLSASWTEASESVKVWTNAA